MSCYRQQYALLAQLKQSATGADAIALTNQMVQLTGNASAVGGCIPGTLCQTFAMVGNVVGGVAVVGAAGKGPANDIPGKITGSSSEAVATSTGKLPSATDGSATSPYSSQGVQYGKTTTTDVNGNPVPVGVAIAPIVDTQAALTQQIGDLRATLTGSARTSGNMGVAQIDIPGIQPTMAASSRIASPTFC